MLRYSDEEIVTMCLNVSSPENYASKYICKKCDISLIAGKMPPQAMVNNLQTFHMSSVLKDLNELEKNLISPIIPFMKVMTLP